MAGATGYGSRRAMKPVSKESKTGSATEEAGGVLTIDLRAIAANYRHLRKHAGLARCAAVVKGDGYGLGLRPVALALADAGCDTFFVALLSEARRLRAALPRAAIYVLNGLHAETAAEFRTLRVEPVLGSFPEIEEWDTFARIEGDAPPAAIHLDTGMARHGLAPDDARQFSSRARHLHFKPSLIMSHLACADEPAHAMNAKQIALFRELAALFPGVPASLANSAALLALKNSHFDLVRPGIALFGGRPVLKADNPMHPTIRLDLRIVQVRFVPAGETVGYGADQRLGRDSRIAVCGAGYADGIFRAAGPDDGKYGAEAVVAGRRCPLVGRISMDLLAVDVTDVPDAEVKRGDFATLIGDGITVDEFAERAGTISYETLANLGRRYARVYVGG